MSIHIHSDYYHDTLETRYCLDCQKRFVVGEELAKSVRTVLCPYCGSSRNEAVAWWEDEDDELGCAGISFRKADGLYYDRCLFCDCKLTSVNTAIEAVCKACKTIHP